MPKSSVKVRGFNEKPSNVKRHPFKKIFLIILVLALIGLLIYYLYPWVSEIQITTKKTLLDLYNSRRIETR